MKTHYAFAVKKKRHKMLLSIYMVFEVRQEILIRVMTFSCAIMAIRV